MSTHDRWDPITSCLVPLVVGVLFVSRSLHLDFGVVRGTSGVAAVD
jgi:hypothetical protein